MSELGNDMILSSFVALGQKLNGLDHNIELLLVGGAAGVLTGLLPAAWTTSDVDTMHCHLPKDEDDVLDAAAEVCRDLSLPADWLNSWKRLHGWTLPDEWMSCRVLVGEFGRLIVYAVSRSDFIAIKFIAHRQKDLDHLALLGVTADDKDFVRRYLDCLEERYPVARYPVEAGKIAMAKQYLENW